MKPIENKYEFMIIFDCENGNPNGDPDADNLPRSDSQNGFGLVSDVAIKRKIRDYLSLVGEEIFVQHKTNLNRGIFEAREKTGEAKHPATAATLREAEKFMCQKYFDVRTFGAVMTTGANAGQLTGPVQITVARSVDPIHIMDWSITRVAVTQDIKSAKSVDDYIAWEAKQPEEERRTMGRKSLIPYGLYVAKGFVSAFDAQITGFSETDLELLCQSILNMFEHSRSASRGTMTTRRLILFRHTSSSTDPKQKKQQAMLGRVPAQRLLELGSIVSVTKVDTSQPPRAYSDYSVIINTTALPEGIEMLDYSQWDEGLFKNPWCSKTEVAIREPTVPTKPRKGSQKT